MAKKTILVVEDEEQIQELMQYHLVRDGFRVIPATTGEAGIKQAAAKQPDAVILDIMLPGMDGLDVCRALKRDPKTASIPILMLTAKGEEADIVAGLELGAEDYITKPFSPKVVIARLRAVLRRRSPETGEGGGDLRVRDLVIHTGRHEVLVKGKPVRLTPTEFRLLQFLAARPGWVFTRYQIVDGVQGDDYAVTERSVDVQIVGLRRKLGAPDAYIETVRGVGYRFKE